MMPTGPMPIPQLVSEDPYGDANAKLPGIERMTARAAYTAGIMCSGLQETAWEDLHPDSRGALCAKAGRLIDEYAQGKRPDAMSSIRTMRLPFRAGLAKYLFDATVHAVYEYTLAASVIDGNKDLAALMRDLLEIEIGEAMNG